MYLITNIEGLMNYKKGQKIKLMQKQIFIFTILILVSCSSSQTKLDTTTKFLASNIAFAATSDVDTTTQILASNVLLSESSANIQAEDVQSAIEEIQPMLSDTIIGTWAVKGMAFGSDTSSASSLPSYTEDTAEITFSSDGTVTLANVIEQDRTVFNYFLNESNTAMTSDSIHRVFEVVDDLVLSFRVYGNQTTDDAFRVFDYAFVLVKSEQDKMVFTYMGYPFIFTKQ